MAALGFPAPQDPPYFKVVIFVDVAQNGFEDVFYYNSVGDTDSQHWADVTNFAQKLAQARVPLSAQNVQITGARITLLDDTQNSLPSLAATKLLTPAELQLPANIAETGPVSPQLAVLVTMRTNIPLIRRSWELRGASTGRVQSNPRAPYSTGVGGVLQGLITEWRNKLVGGTQADRGFNGSLCMQGHRRPNTGGATARPLLEVGLTADNVYLKYRIATPTTQFQIGDRILIRGLRLDCGKGANGLMFVTKVDTTTTPGTTWIETDRRWKCRGDPLVIKYGILYANILRLWKIQTAAASRIVSRDTGPPTIRTRGRRSGSAR